jgi:hypothetical protein
MRSAHGWEVLWKSSFLPLQFLYARYGPGISERLRFAGRQGSQSLSRMSIISVQDMDLKGILEPGESGDRKAVTHLRFLLNFADELRRRVPARGM